MSGSRLVARSSMRKDSRLRKPVRQLAAVVMNASLGPRDSKVRGRLVLE